MNICGADVRTPREAVTFLTNLATVYGETVANLDLFKSHQDADGVSGEPIEFLGAMSDQATAAAAAMTAGAERAEEHRVRIADTIGADPSLHGTQDGGYADVAAL